MREISLSTTKGIVKKNIYRLPLYFFSGLKFHLAGSFYTPKPQLLTLGITSRCNARCLMCSLWKKDTIRDLSIDEIEKLIKNPLFNRLKTVTLSGGEPSLREDLPLIVNTIIKSIPSVKNIGINTNGIEPSLIESHLVEIFSFFPKKMNFFVQLSIDGYGEVHDKIRGMPNAFARAKETLIILKGLDTVFPFRTQIVCVIQKKNIENLPLLSEFASHFCFPIRYSPVCKTPENSAFFEGRLMPTQSQLELLKTYFNSPLMKDLDLPSIAFWKDYFQIVNGKKRTIPCALPDYGIFIGAEGNLFICGEDDDLVYGNIRKKPLENIWYGEKARKLRKDCKKNRCPICFASCATTFSLSLEFYYFSWFLIKSLLPNGTYIQ